MSYIFGYNYLFEEHRLGENYKKWEYLYACDYRIKYNNTIYYLDMYNRLYKYKDGDKSNPVDCYLELLDKTHKKEILHAAFKQENVYVRRIRSV